MKLIHTSYYTLYPHLKPADTQEGFLGPHPSRTPTHLLETTGHPHLPTRPSSTGTERFPGPTASHGTACTSQVACGHTGGRVSQFWPVKNMPMSHGTFWKPPFTLDISSSFPVGPWMMRRSTLNHDNKGHMEVEGSLAPRCLQSHQS